MDTGILLQSGTNELEVLEFNVGPNHYGINVAKVKEIMPFTEPTPIPNAHDTIEGIFMPRDTIVTIVDLAKSLMIPPSPDRTKDMYIVTNFNNLNIGFHVHGVQGIHRLTKAGYVNINATTNGEEAWNTLLRYKAEGDPTEQCHCIITDIEMPKMDGHRLTKLVKDDNELKQIPVIIFSSLINDEMRRKGESLGADAQLTKPEIGKLVEAIDGLVLQ